MDRNEIKTLRPELFIENSDSTSSIELFQNEVLRPVIKFQHDLIIHLVTAHPLFAPVTNNKGPRLQFQKRVKDFISGQSTLKNQLIGSIVGLLTEEEITYYAANPNELNKRIHGMICQRVADTLY